MSYLDWYLHLNDACRESGYDLGLLICGDPQTVVKKIIPGAVEIACRNARKQNRRDEPSRTHWKMLFTDPQLYQIGILEASQSHAKTLGTDANRLIRYIAFLCLCTLQRNSFYVAVGFERILSTGSAREILELYEWLSHRLCPNNPPIGRDEKSANDICGSLHAQIYSEFKDMFQTSGPRLVFDEVPKNRGSIHDEICRILDKMIPWETEHLAANQADRSTHKRTIAEMSLAHVCIDQQLCLEEVKRDNRHISQCFDSWRVPVPAGNESNEPPCKQAPGWHDVQEEIMKEIHWSEERSKRGWGSIFEVVVDGEIKGTICTRGSRNIELPSSARYVEIREAESGTMVANCHLMDPHDLPESGWKTAVDLTSTSRVVFEFSPDQLAAGSSDISMKIDINARRAWATLLDDWTKRAFATYATLGRIRSPALSGAVTVLAVAASIAIGILSGEAYRLRARVNELQRQNSDLRTQASDLSALEKEIAEFRQSAIQPLNRLPLEALYDGTRLVVLDENGNVSGLEAMPPEFQRMIKAALKTGKVEAPELRTLGSSVAELMGKKSDPQAFALISPVGVVVETDRPTFRWKPLAGTLGYTVSISDSDYNEVASSESLKRTEWTVDRPLKRGKAYSWQVIAVSEGKEIKSPAAPGTIASFQVLSQGKAGELAQARKTYADSHLVMGLLYARAGLLSEAKGEFNALLSANPKSTASQKLLRSVKTRR